MLSKYTIKLNAFLHKKPKVGLALGSGSAKGLSHIGVLKILEENNIPINYIAGSSIGALVGGLYASGLITSKIEQILKELTASRALSLLDPTLKQSIIGGKKVENFLNEELNNATFKDLKIPLKVVATDLATGNPVILSKGNVASAIRASIALPVVFKPTEYDGKLLTDGGISIPVPVEVVRNMGAKVVIAVNLDSYGVGKKKEKLGLYKIATHSINILQHNLGIHTSKNADIIIMPKTGHVPWDKFVRDSQYVIDAGYKAAQEALPKIKRLTKTS